MRKLSLTILTMLAMAGASSALADPIGYAINSRGNFEDDTQVFALWRIDLATGAETYVGWTGAGINYTDIEGLALDSDGNLFGADDDTNSLLRISRSTGAPTPVGGSAGNMGLAEGQMMDFGMTFDCEDRLWVSSEVEQTLYEADPKTGLLSVAGSEGALDAPVTGIAARGDQMFGIGQGSYRESSGGPDLRDAPYLFSIDPESGTADKIGPLGDSEVGLYHNAGLAFDEDGQLWAIVDRRDLNGQDLPSLVLRIDPETGQAEVVSETIVGIESLTIAPPGGCNAASENGDEPAEDEPPFVIPTLNPAGLAFLVLMLAGLAMWRIRA